MYFSSKLLAPESGLEPTLPLNRRLLGPSQLHRRKTKPASVWERVSSHELYSRLHTTPGRNIDSLHPPHGYGVMFRHRYINLLLLITRCQVIARGFLYFSFQMTMVGAAGLEPAYLIEALVLQTSADCHYLHRAHKVAESRRVERP